MSYWELEFNIDDDRAAFPDDVITAPAHIPAQPERCGTYDERRQWFIAESCCPRPGCHAQLDDGSCPQCAWTLADERSVEWSPEQEPDYLPTLPLALTLDEYAAAQIDEEAA